MFQSDTIYSRDSKGQTRTWSYEVEGDKWRSVAGLMSGQKVTSGWTTSKPKNVGKKNATTAEEQASAEAAAEMVKKLERDYRCTIEALATVPPSPMLAQDFSKQKKIPFPCYAQPKLDGIRALISRHGAFSREYQRHFNVEHIIEALAPFFEQYPGAILDGELYNHALHDDFNTITSVVRKQNVKDEDRARARELVQFHCYDVILGDLADPGFEERTHFLSRELPICEEVEYVTTLKIFGREELDRWYAKWIDEGYEGQMVRTIDAPYGVDKRPKDLLKRKEFITEEFSLVDIQEGNGNWAGCAKRIVARLKDGTTSDAGMRGDQAFAKKLLAEKAKYIGGQVTIRYFGVTPDGKLRMAVAIDFHPEGRKD